MQCGGNGNIPSVFVASDPDGALSMPKGAYATDTTTGIVYRNEDGATKWWPVFIPPRMGFILFCDFIGSGGGSGLGQTLAGTGAAAFGGDLGLPGYIQASVAAVSDAVSLRGANAANTFNLGNAKTWLEARVVITTAEDGTNRFSTRVGFGDADAADFTDGAYFESSLAGNASANWFRCTANNGTRTKTDTGVAPVAGTYQRLRIKVNAAGTSVDFEIDGVSVGSNTTNIPKTSGRESGIAFQSIKTLGTTARTSRLDYVDMAQVFTAAR